MENNIYKTKIGTMREKEKEIWRNSYQLKVNFLSWKWKPKPFEGGGWWGKEEAHGLDQDLENRWRQIMQGRKGCIRDF